MEALFVCAILSVALIAWAIGGMHGYDRGWKKCQKLYEGFLESKSQRLREAHDKLYAIRQALTEPSCDD